MHVLLAAGPIVILGAFSWNSRILTLSMFGFCIL